MKYEFTNELLTKNNLIDNEHKELFEVVNNLIDLCEKGRGRESINKTIEFLIKYVNNHFINEENLQIKNQYPNYTKHKNFHEIYKKELLDFSNEIHKSGINITTLSKLNHLVNKIINHIKIDDKKMATYINNLANKN